MAEREALSAAIRNVEALNREAGVSSDTLTAIVTISGTESGKAAFEQLSLQLLGSVKKCFAHFQRVRPQLAKMRAHRDFHTERLGTLPQVWNAFTTRLGLPELEPLHQQAVNRELFAACMRDLLVFPEPPTPPVRMLADEENAVRYASGYVAMKLCKKLEKSKGSKEVRFKQCLSAMANGGDDSSYYAYTLEWFNAIDRGRLFYMNDAAFQFFRSIEVRTQQLLPNHLTGLSHTNKEELLRTVMHDSEVQRCWSIVSTDISDENDSNELLQMIVDMWITLRGFALTSKWLEDYKLAKGKTVNKSKSLRKDLQSSAED